MPYSRELELAIDSGSTAKVQSLLQTFDWTDKGDGFLPSSYYLMLAAETGKVELVKLLVKAGADVNQPDEEGWTVLMFAGGEGNFDIVRVLVEANADVNFESPTGEHALETVARQGHQEIFDYLAPLTNLDLREEAEQKLSEGIGKRRQEEAVDPAVDMLILAASDGNLRKVKKLIEAGVDVNGIDAYDTTPLSAAAPIFNNIKVVRILLEAGADPNIAPLDSPLLAAVGSKCMEMVSGAGVQHTVLD